MSNSDHPRIGAHFQIQVKERFQENYGNSFQMEKKLKIGNPAKDHRFDIVNVTRNIVIECKCYTWTESGNVPSAKMGFTNEAAFYLSFLPNSYEKYIVMLKSYHPGRKQTLAEYYYRANRHLLGSIKVAEYDLEKKTLTIINKDDIGEDGAFLTAIQKYLSSKDLVYDTDLPEKIKERKAGKKYSVNEHIRGIIYSLLTNQTKWHRIEPHIKEIDKLFFDYDPEKILYTDSEYFVKGLFQMKCGNVSTKPQMESLTQNIRKIQEIETEFGSMDAFIESEPAEVIVRKISDSASPYKIKMLGEALAWEYLRYMGIDGAKPDTHLRRFFGSDRMGALGNHSPATAREVQTQVDRLSEKTGLLKAEIDNLIWSLCADGYGEICTASPHCEKCPIQDMCNKSRD